MGLSGLTEQTFFGNPLSKWVIALAVAGGVAEFGRAHFKSYGDFALIYEIIFLVNDPDYDTYMDIQQQINLELYRRFAEEKIEFAYPTQTLHVRHSEPSLHSTPKNDSIGPMC